MRKSIVGIFILIMAVSIYGQSAIYFAKSNGDIVNVSNTPAIAKIKTSGNESFDSLTQINAWVTGREGGNQITIQTLSGVYGNLTDPQNFLIKNILNTSYGYTLSQLFHNPLGEQKIKFRVIDGQAQYGVDKEITVFQYSLTYPPLFNDAPTGKSTQLSSSTAVLSATTGGGTLITGGITFNPNIVGRYFPYNSETTTSIIPGVSFRAADCKVKVTATNATNLYTNIEEVSLTETNANSATLSYQLPYPPANKVPKDAGSYYVDYNVELLRKKLNNSYEAYPMNNSGDAQKLNAQTLQYQWVIPSSYIADTGHIWSGFTPQASWQSNFPKLTRYQRVNKVDASGAVVMEGSYEKWTHEPGVGFGFDILYDLIRYWQIPYDASNFKIELSTSGNQANQLKFIYGVNNTIISQGTTLTLPSGLLTLRQDSFNGGEYFLQPNFNANRIKLFPGDSLYEDDGGVEIEELAYNGIFILPTASNAGTQKTATSLNKYFGPGGQIMYTEYYYTRAIETNIKITITYSITMKDGVKNFGKTLTIPCTFTFGVETLYQSAGGF